jgi:hypothetical protein
MLLLQYVGNSSDEQKELLRQKEKSKIPIPFCCIRFRPSKPCQFSVPFIVTPLDFLTRFVVLDFLHALKWSVLQCELRRSFSFDDLETD